MGGTGTPDVDEILARVRARREALFDAMIAVGAALEAPNGTAWVARLRDALAHLQVVLSEHARATEATGGFFDEIVRRSPRLKHGVDVLRVDHVELLDHLASLIKLVEADPDPDVEETRGAGVALLAALARHRQRGADLIYESYVVDIGGQG